MLKRVYYLYFYRVFLNTKLDQGVLKYFLDFIHFCGLTIINFLKAYCLNRQYLVLNTLLFSSLTAPSYET